MKAGTGAADITPTPGMILQGHWSDTPSHTVLFPLEVRAIVFEQDNTRAAIVTVDAIGVTQAITQCIRARIEHSTGITPACVMVVASHTHCAPAVLALGGSDADEAFAESIIERSVDCVCSAASRLRPVTFGIGCGSAHFNVNRRPNTHDADLKVNEAGVVDRRVRVLSVDDDDSRPVAVLFHYSCHPTTKGGNEGYISYDYPGIARDVLLDVDMGQHEGVRSSSEPNAQIIAAAIRARLGATWGIGETGAAGPTGNPYGDAAGHTQDDTAAIPGTPRTQSTSGQGPSLSLVALTRLPWAEVNSPAYGVLPGGIRSDRR